MKPLSSANMAMLHKQLQPKASRKGTRRDRRGKTALSAAVLRPIRQ
jgi:hypothetical protein